MMNYELTLIWLRRIVWIYSTRPSLWPSAIVIQAWWNVLTWSDFSSMSSIKWPISMIRVRRHMINGGWHAADWNTFGFYLTTSIYVFTYSRYWRWALIRIVLKQSNYQSSKLSHLFNQWDQCLWFSHYLSLYTPCADWFFSCNIF